MKLRCSANSIRVRVRKSEVELLKAGAALEENVQFGSSVFSFGLQQTGDSKVNATFENGNITLSVPEKEMTHWLNTEQVGIEAEHSIDGGKSLNLLIEKDFPCVTRTTEDKSDTFRELSGGSDRIC